MIPRSRGQLLRYESVLKPYAAVKFIACADGWAIGCEFLGEGIHSEYGLGHLEPTLLFVPARPMKGTQWRVS